MGVLEVAKAGATAKWLRARAGIKSAMLRTGATTYALGRFIWHEVG